MTISEVLRRQVIEEANYRCEYCKSSSQLTGTLLVMDRLSLVSLPKKYCAQVALQQVEYLAISAKLLNLVLV